MYKTDMCRQGRVTWVIFITLLQVAVSAQTQLPPISIRVVEGDRAINSIKLHRGHDPVVQVTNAAGEPIPGAAVTFLLPASGAGGTLGDSGLSQTVQSDSRGMAAARGFRPNRVEGQFRIRVTTSWQGETAGATVVQTNAEPVAKSSNSKWLVIAIAIGGAAAGGAVAATHGSKSSTAAIPSAGSSTATITPGSPAFGPPK
jgi:hypothetical protein